MLKNILAGLQNPNQQVTGAQEMPNMQQMPMVMQQAQPMQMDPYGQQMGGLKAALMGRFMNAR